MYFILIIPVICCISIRQVFGEHQAILTADDIASYLFPGGHPRLIWSAKHHNTVSTIPQSYPYIPDTFWEKYIKSSKRAYRAKYSPIPYEIPCGIGKFTSKPDNRIVGGENARHGEFPWQVSLQFEIDDNNSTKLMHSCGGSIINSEWIITAAHCIYKPQNILVVAGEHELNRKDGTEQYRSILEIYMHGYNPSQLSNDIALLKVEPLKLDGRYTAPVCLPNSKLTFTSGAVSVSGWGQLNFWEKPLSKILQKVRIPIMDNKACRKIWKIRINECHLCVSEKRKSTCKGDSGGPVVCYLDDHRWYLCGIVSFSRFCGHTGYPAVYALVPCHTDYVVNITGLK